MRHARFGQFGEFLAEGDLVVVNASATLAAAVDGDRAGVPVEVHFSAELDDGAWVVEVRPAGASTGPVTGLRSGEVIGLADGVALVLDGPRPAGQDRLWRAELRAGQPMASPARSGSRVSRAAPRLPRPARAADPLRATCRGSGRSRSTRPSSAAEPGSAEMPSAGRPFTAEVVTDLVTRGVALAPIVLHTGVSSQEPGEPPQPERFRVPESTARLVNATRAAGGRVVAVGTTVTRALESAAGPDGTVRARSGWTDLVLGPAARPGGERAGDRLARARRVAPGAADRRGRVRACRAGLRGGAAPGVSVARVRRQLPAAAVSTVPDADRCSSLLRRPGSAGRAAERRGGRSWAVSSSSNTSHWTGSSRTRAGAAGTSYGGWLYRFGPEPLEGDKFRLGEIMDNGALLLGRRTFEEFAALWPGRDDWFSARMNAWSKLVASRSLADASAWQNSELLDCDDLVKEVEARSKDTDIVVTGSLSVVRELQAADLVDEYRLIVLPLVIGEGSRLFPDGTGPVDLALGLVEAAGQGVRLIYSRKERMGGGSE